MANIDVTQLIDRRRLGWFNWKVVLFGFFLTLFEGFDGGTVSYVSPVIIKEWGIVDMRALGLTFSLGLAATFVGAPLLGWIADRYGRKPAIVTSALLVSLTSLATMAASNLVQLAVLRFITGIGIGGLMPTIIALNAEYAPKRYRATLITVMFTGLTLGAGLPGTVAGWLMAHHGWQSLFLVGGIITLLITAVSALWLPESIKYLVLHGRHRDASRLVAELAPGTDLAAARFIVSEERAPRGFSPRLLFTDGLRFITPLLWLLAICNTGTFYFVTTWLPTVLHSSGIPLTRSALALTFFQVGGTAGGLSIARPLDRIGLMPVCVLFLLAIPITISIGYAALWSQTALMVAVFLAGFTLLGLQFGINATSALIYPTAFRANGSGWTFAIGKVGSVTGPLVAGFLIGMHLPIQQLYLFLAVPLTVATLAAFVLARLYFVRFHGMALNRRDAIAAE